MNQVDRGWRVHLRAWGLRALVLAGGVMGVSGSAQAWSRGITTDRFADPALGCNNCHSGAAAPTVTLMRADSTSSTVLPGATVPLEVTIETNSGNCFGGFNVSTASEGLMLDVADGETGTTRHASNEVTHTTPRAASDWSVGSSTTDCSGAIVFLLEATMPSTSGSVTLTAWGNNVNLMNLQSGDRAADDTLTLSVQALGYGQACTADSQCAGGNCVDGVCCRSASCSAGDGQCLGPATCQAGSGSCGVSAPLPAGSFCDDGDPSTSQDSCDGAGECVGRQRDGTVWTWGDNSFGQLGRGTIGSNSSTPMLAEGPAHLVAVDGGQYHSVALAADGTVWTWGYNARGQLGDPAVTATYSSEPVQAATFARPMLAVAAGGTHTLALAFDGQVWAWGSNLQGQLGDPAFTGSRSAAPRLVPGLRDVIAIAAGDRHSMALTADGRLWAWGGNDEGQIGDGTRTMRRSPTRPTIGRFMKQIAAGSATSYALGSNGVVYSWGSNWQEALGQARSGVVRELTPRSTPVTGARDIAAGSSHGLAILSDGTVRAWGHNQFGGLGLGHTDSPVSYPGPVPGLDGVIDVAAGGAHSAFLRDDGTVWVTGSNYAGQLGGASSGDLDVPTRVPELSGVASISSTDASLLAVEPLGSVAAWGDDTYAQLGLGSGGTGGPTPTIQFVRDPGGVLDADGRRQLFKDVSAGCYHGLAVATNGTVWAWGNNGVGQAGQGAATADIDAPVQVPGLDGVIDVEAGCYHSAALRSDGTVWTWGYNGFGTLGVGDTTTRYSPVSVPLRPTTQISGSFFHMLALQDSGGVRAWGYNAEHQVDGSSGNVLSPVVIRMEISGLRMRQVVAGTTASYIVHDDGNLSSWGGNAFGELGNGSTGSGRSAPRRIPNLVSVTKVSAGASFALTLTAYGALWAWGQNAYGNYAFGAASQYSSPALLAGTWATDVEAGYFNSAAELTQTMWLTSGYGLAGVLGTGSLQSAGWTVVDPLSSAVQIDIGAHHAYALTL